MQADAVRDFAGQDQCVTTNNQPVWNPRTDYYKLGEHLTVSGSNYYPPYGDKSRHISFGLAACRSYRDQTFHVHELRNSAHMIPGRPDNTPAPGEVARLTFHCIANGADAIFYFRWRSCPYGCEQSHGTIVDYDGRPRRIYPEVQGVGRKLRELASEILGTNVCSKVGILYDFAARWAMETGIAWNGPKELYMSHTQKIYRSIRNLGYNCDITNPYANHEKYKVLVVPMLPVVTEDVVDKLVAYVENGGTMIWHPFCGMKDSDCCIYMDRIHPRLKPLIGSDIQEYITLSQEETTPFQWNGKKYNAHLFCDNPVSISAEENGVYSDSWYAGTPAILTTKVGKGKCVYITTFAEEAFYTDFFAEMFPATGVIPCLGTEIPAAVEIVSRSTNDRELIFLLNHSDSEQYIKLPESMQNIYAGVKETAELKLAPYGVAILKR